MSQYIPIVKPNLITTERYDRLVLLLSSNPFKQECLINLCKLINNHPWLTSPQPIENQTHQGNLDQKFERCKQVANTPNAHLLLVLQDLTDKGYISVEQATQFFQDNSLFSQPSNEDKNNLRPVTKRLLSLIEARMPDEKSRFEASEYAINLLRTPIVIVAEDTSTYLFFQKKGGEFIELTPSHLGSNENSPVNKLIEVIKRVASHHNALDGEEKKNGELIQLEEVCPRLFGEHAAKYFSHLGLEQLFHLLSGFQNLLRKENIDNEGRLVFEFNSLISGVRLYPDGSFEELKNNSGTSLAYLAPYKPGTNALGLLQLSDLLNDPKGNPLRESVENGDYPYAVQIAFKNFLNNNSPIDTQQESPFTGQYFSPYLEQIPLAIIGAEVLRNRGILVRIAKYSELSPQLSEFKPSEALELHNKKDPNDPLINSAVFLFIPPNNTKIEEGLAFVELVLGQVIQNSAVGDQAHLLIMLNEQNNRWVSLVQEILQATINNHRTPYTNSLLIVSPENFDFDGILKNFGSRPLPYNGFHLSCDLSNPIDSEVNRDTIPSSGFGFFGAAKAEVPLSVLENYEEFWNSLVEWLIEEYETKLISFNNEFIQEMSKQGLPLHRAAGVTFSAQMNGKTVGDPECRKLIAEIGNNNSVEMTNFTVKVPCIPKPEEFKDFWDGGGSPPGNHLPAQTLMGLFGQNYILCANEENQLQVIRPKGVSTPNLLILESGEVPSGHGELRVVETIHRRLHEVLEGLQVCFFHYGGIGTVHEIIGAVRRGLKVVLISPNQQDFDRDPVWSVITQFLKSIGDDRFHTMVPPYKFLSLFSDDT